MAGRTSSRKGTRGEVDVKAKLAQWLNLPESEFQRSVKGKKMVDIGFSLRARELFPYHVEVKNHKVPAYEAWIAQSLRDSELVSEGAEAIVIFKEERKIFVLTRLENFCYLCQKMATEGYTQVYNGLVEATATRSIGMWVKVPFNVFMELATMDMAGEQEAA